MAFKRRLPLKANLFTFVGLLVIGVIVLVITPCLRAIKTSSNSSSDSSSTVTSQASNQYHVYYDLNENHSLENSPPQLITEGEKTNFPIIDRMWYSIMDQTQTKDFETSYFDFNSKTITSDLTLQAQWVKNTYIVTFDLNGGTRTLPLPQTTT